MRYRERKVSIMKALKLRPYFGQEHIPEFNLFINREADGLYERVVSLQSRLLAGFLG
jgi:hypothetical protein